MTCFLVEVRKHRAKCSELGWVCVPLAVETYGNWGKEAHTTFSHLASCIATNPRHEAIEEEEEDHRNEDIEDDVPEEESMLEGGKSEGTDPLECKLGDEMGKKWRVE